MFEEPDAVPGVFELVDVGPHFSLPSLFVGGGFAAGGTTGMEGNWSRFGSDGRGSWQLDKNAADFFDFLVFAENVLVPQQISKAKFLGFALRLGTRVKWTVLRPQLFGGVTCHPESLFVRHCWFRPWGREAGSWLLEPALANQIASCNFGTAVFPPISIYSIDS